jgi:hypothetical protein
MGLRRPSHYLFSAARAANGAASLALYLLVASRCLGNLQL